MAGQTETIERLIPPVGTSDLHALARILVDASGSGEAVSFLAPLTLEQAADWCQTTLSQSGPGAVFLVARDAGEIVGTVQLQPARAPNQPHRAEVAKLLVASRSRRAGLGSRLMRAIEEAARRYGFRLLTLDAKRGTAANRPYRRLGWIHAGTIPRFAFDSDGATLHDAVVLYKELSSDEAR